MIQFEKPKEFEGVQLCNELNAAGIDINRETSPLIDGNGILWLDIDAANETIAASIVAAHTGAAVVTQSQDTTTARQALLDKLGITADEAQLLLGGN